MSKEPDKTIELEDLSNGHSQWIELYVGVNGERVRVVKKNDMPVHDESTYVYSSEEGDMSFVSGRKSCSGAGKTRSKSPSDSIDSKIREALEEIEKVPAVAS